MKNGTAVDMPNGTSDGAEEIKNGKDDKKKKEDIKMVGTFELVSKFMAYGMIKLCDECCTCP